MRVLNIFNKVFNNFNVQIHVKNKLRNNWNSQKTTEYSEVLCIKNAGKNSVFVIFGLLNAIFRFFGRYFLSKSFQK